MAWSALSADKTHSEETAKVEYGDTNGYNNGWIFEAQA
jgi:hypothetical protein